MGQVEGGCNGAADRLEVGRRQDGDDILPLGAFHAVEAREGDGGDHVALGPATHGGLAGHGVGGERVVMILQRRGHGGGERHDRDQLAVLAVAGDHHDGADLDHLGHDIALEIAHHDAAGPGLIEQSHHPF